MDTPVGSYGVGWRATGVLSGDSLLVRYSVAMRYSQSAWQFQDGVHLLLGGTEPSLPPLDGRIAFSGDHVGLPYVYVANADGSGITPVTSGREPTWSPNGRKIAFARWLYDSIGPPGVYLMDADGSNETWLAAGYDPGWSPDGTRIAFTGNEGIMVVNVDGTGASTLLDFDSVWGLDPDGMGASRTRPGRLTAHASRSRGSAASTA
jgi:dipeptidyl aminopeptidase/acylaminoacyl peptidase